MKLKDTLSLVVVSWIAILLSGCPIGMDYPLGNPGTEEIDRSLLGTWTAGNPDAAVTRVRIDRGDDYSYSVHVMGRGEMYSLETDDLTGYVTGLDGHRFVYFRPGNESKYYLYEYSVDATGRVTTHDVGLKVGGVDAVTSTESYRREVSASLKFDDCLTEPTVWTRE
jgi:hypothetical protein